MADVIVIGNGGHARSCIDAWSRTAVDQPLGCTGAPGSGPSQIPYLGTDDVLGTLRAAGHTHAFVAIGDAHVRDRLSTHARELGFQPFTLVAESAQVGTSATVGPGAAVLRGTVVGAFARIGEGAIINTAATVDHDCTVGRFSHIAPGTHLAGNVTVGDHTVLGVGVSVIPGIHIGSDVSVGAGAVVVEDVEDGQTVVGVPARPIQRKVRSL